MRLLEKELGVALFNRTRHGMRLTEEGEELRARIVGPLRQLRLTLQDIRSFSLTNEASLALGMPPTVGCVLARPLLLRSAQEMPKVSLQLVEGQPGHLMDRLLRGEIDLAVLYGSTPDGRLLTRDLLIEDLMLVGPPGCALSPDTPVNFRDLADMPFILPTTDQGLRGIIERSAAKAKTLLNIRFQVDSLALTKELVEMDAGYAILPFASFSAEARSSRLKYARIRNPSVTRQLVLAGRPECQMPRVMVASDVLVQKVVTELVSSGSWPARLLLDEVES